MSNSPLVTYTRITSKKTSPRTHEIDTITIHCIVGQWTAKKGCDYFATTSRNASCNYVVGCDGSIGLCVEEKDRSWCSSSSANDNRAITIETASDTKAPYAVTDEAYNALLDLITDICKRNNIKKLLWKADKTLIGQVDKQNMTVHKWFANKDCPGAYLYNRHSDIAKAVNARLVSNDTSNAKQIWDYFMAKLDNEYGVAGLMGNLEAESGLHPDRVQGDVPYSSYSQEYTAQVDSGAISQYDFIYNGPGGGGYGLAQWTYSTRKRGLYELWKSGGYSSIGSLELAMDYLWQELTTDFPRVVSVLKSATAVKGASNIVLHEFENPADQSATVEDKRASMSQVWYDKYHLSSPTTGNDNTHTWKPVLDNAGNKQSMSLLLLTMASRRRVK